MSPIRFCYFFALSFILSIVNYHLIKCTFALILRHLLFFRHQSSPFVNWCPLRYTVSVFEKLLLSYKFLFLKGALKIIYLTVVSGFGLSNATIVSHHMFFRSMHHALVVQWNNGTEKFWKKIKFFLHHVPETCCFLGNLSISNKNLLLALRCSAKRCRCGHSSWYPTAVDRTRTRSEPGRTPPHNEPSSATSANIGSPFESSAISGSTWIRCSASRSWSPTRTSPCFSPNSNKKATAYSLLSAIYLTVKRIACWR